MSTKIKIIISLSLLILMLILVIQNVSHVGIHFFFWSFSMSGALLFIVLFISGAFFGGSLLGYFQKKKKENK